jgi:hypothetical protein
MTDAWWSPDGPWFHELPAATALDDLLAGQPRDSVTFELDGSMMRDHDALFAEFASKLDFPDYFGGNWPALSDCLDDMLWFDEKGGFLIVIEHWAQVLADAPIDLPVLKRILNEIGSNWGSMGYDGTGTQRIPFNTVAIADV